MTEETEKTEETEETEETMRTKVLCDTRPLSGLSGQITTPPNQ